MSLQSTARAFTSIGRTKTKSITGYAAVFGAPDLSGDIIERGAFEQSLKDIPFNRVRCLYAHDPDQPIGRWVDVREDDFGLFVEGEIDLGNRAALKGGE